MAPLAGVKSGFLPRRTQADRKAGRKKFRQGLQDEQDFKCPSGTRPMVRSFCRSNSFSSSCLNSGLQQPPSVPGEGESSTVPLGRKTLWGPYQTLACLANVRGRSATKPGPIPLDGINRILTRPSGAPPTGRLWRETNEPNVCVKSDTDSAR